MGLLKGTDLDECEVTVKCTALLPQKGKTTPVPVSFNGIYLVPVNDRHRITDVRSRLVDRDDEYDDEQLVDEFFVRWEKMPAEGGGYVECNDEAKAEALQNRFYFDAIAKGCAQALFEH